MRESLIESEIIDDETDYGDYSVRQGTFNNGTSERGTYVNQDEGQVGMEESRSCPTDRGKMPEFKTDD